MRTSSGFTRATVADLRASYAQLPGRRGIDRLVTEMLALSPQFAQMWASHEVEERGPMLKHVHHPLAGPLEFECQVLHIAGTGQRLIAYCAAPGSPTEAGFRLLAASQAPVLAFTGRTRQRRSDSIAGTYERAPALMK